MINVSRGLNLVSLMTGLFILLNSVLLLYSYSNVNGQESMNETLDQNVSNATQTPGEGVDRSIIGTVINITNNTNPTGAAVQQMIQATSTANNTTTANNTSLN
jgi:hypothetical protein